MTQEEEIELEEILLGYLRSSKKIKLAKLNVKKDNNQKHYQITFEVENNFPGSLLAPVSPFFDVLKEINNESKIQYNNRV